MINVIGTGLSGLVGSRITYLLQDMCTFTDLSKETGVDLMDFPTVTRMITDSSAQWVFHFAAYTDVQGAEKEKDSGLQSVSWKVNVEATEHIVSICRETGKKLLYISTDYVFDGKQDSFDEASTPHPISWYGRTKYEGEVRVGELGKQALIIRIANPYRSNPIGKMDFVHKMIERLRENLDITAPSDQTFSPTYIDDLGDAIRILQQEQASGIYHVVSNGGISPFEAAQSIAKEFGLPDGHIHETSYDSYFSGKALPPKQAVLKHDKINASGVTLHSFSEGLHEVHVQEQKGAIL